MNKKKNKPIPFNLENKRDVELLSYAEKRGMPFASYIKILIEKDMLNSFEKYNKKNEMKDMIVEILKEMNLNSNNLEDDSDKVVRVSRTQKKSIKGIIGDLNNYKKDTTK